MDIVCPPINLYAVLERYERAIFLAGSIEMGKAEDWQTRFAEGLDDMEGVILNPRRADWDSSWVQSIQNPEFRGQVEWELYGIESADVVVVYFDPNTQSPVTLLELGFLAAHAPQKTIVCCPDGFWRKGNVDIVCARYGIMNVKTMDALLAEARRRLCVL